MDEAIKREILRLSLQFFSVSEKSPMHNFAKPLQKTSDVGGGSPTWFGIMLVVEIAAKAMCIPLFGFRLQPLKK